MSLNPILISKFLCDIYKEEEEDDDDDEEGAGQKIRERLYINIWFV